MLEEDLFGPTFLIVAVGAILPLLSLMHIHGTMAVEAGYIAQCIHRSGPMASVTDQILMLALQGELGVLAMIEFDLFPTLYAMTILALLSITPFVLVIFLMAGVAGF